MSKTSAKTITVKVGDSAVSLSVEQARLLESQLRSLVSPVSLDPFSIFEPFGMFPMWRMTQNRWKSITDSRTDVEAGSDGKCVCTKPVVSTARASTVLSEDGSEYTVTVE